ncbi:MAG: thiamine phosphate synthase [Longimicrobiales bacterium]
MRARTPDGLARRLRLTVVTDARLSAPTSVVEVVAAALRGGATAVQLRNKGDSARTRIALGRSLRALTREHDALLIVNDRLDIALLVEADGLHVGPDDLPVSAVRNATPPGFVIGRSADDPAVARRAVSDGASYIGCGAVFGSTTKDVGGEAIGPAGVRRVVEAVNVPVVAIGGIAEGNVAALSGTGVAGVAVVGAVMAAPDPRRAARALRGGLDTLPR